MHNFKSFSLLRARIAWMSDEFVEQLDSPFLSVIGGMVEKLAAKEQHGQQKI